MKAPLISIITVVYNCVSSIEETILSVINQTYSNLEYIIIDGGSTDGTVDIVKKYAEKITFWMSESDNGVYDGMNKGIDRANGEWINFMNAGDNFFNNNVLFNIFSQDISDKTSIIYGDTLQCFSYGRFMTKPDELVHLNKHMIFCHQSAFVRRSLLQQYNFDTTYRICADYNLFYNLYKDGLQFQYVPLCIAIYDASDGISSINRLEVLKEESKINGISSFEYFNSYIKNRARACLSTILPRKIFNIILSKWSVSKKQFYIE